MTTVTFLGTGNFLAPGRYWNSFVLDGNVLVEPSPTALPHLRRCGLSAAGPRSRRDLPLSPRPHVRLAVPAARGGAAPARRRPFSVVGPPGVEAFLADMMALGAVTDIVAAAHRQLDVRFIEVDGSWQEAGPLRFRAIEVEHVPTPALLRVRHGDATAAGSATRATSTPAPGSTTWPVHATCWSSSATVPTRLRSPTWTSSRSKPCARSSRPCRLCSPIWAKTSTPAGFPT